MSIAQIVAVGIIGTTFSVTLRKLNPETALFVGIITGIVIFFSVLGRLAAVLDVLNGITDTVALNKTYISVIMKVIGIAYIAEFGVQICKDAGEGAIASKIELAGKVLIMTVSVPVIVGVIEMINTVLP